MSRPGSPSPERSPSAPQTRTEDPSVCRACASPLVYPTRWRILPSGTWSVHLRCPECEAVCRSLLGEPQMDLLDTAVNSGTELLLENLRSLSAERLIECVEAHLVESDLLREQADRFICALNAGQILPEDF